MLYILAGIDNLLRNVPSVLSSQYIIRQEFVDSICSQLKKINTNGGHILVHGMAGSGKTIAVSQAVQQVVEKDSCFQDQGVYWIKIGNYTCTNKLRSLLFYRH